MTRPESPGEKRRALVIEDDRAIAELERDYLEAAGFAVDIETDGRTALERITREVHDVYVVDLMLPRADGFTLCCELRARSERPVIVVSARGGDVDKVRALGLGIDDYVTKPFSPAELVARARAHVDRYERLRGSGPGGVVVAGDLVIDEARRSVSVGGRQVQLTATEFEILLLLARDRGRVFSREEIFECIRGEGTHGDFSTVTVHVRRLREKVEDDPSRPERIETVWGMGYRFVS